MLRAIAPDSNALSALDDGRGASVLVVPPGGGDAGVWDAVAQRLATHRRVARLQRRIYAPGVSIALPHTMATEAGDVLAIAACLPAPVVAVGHSSGAVAALEAALRDRHAFAGLVLYEPPLPTTELVARPVSSRARARLDAGDPAGAMKLHMRDVVRMPPDVVEAMFADPRAGEMFGTHAAGQLADNEAIDALGVGIERYRTLKLPVVLIEGSDSPAHLRARLADLAATLPNVMRVVTLDGQGHVAHLTAPGLLSEIVDAAVRDILAQGLCQPRRGWGPPGAADIPAH